MDIHLWCDPVQAARRSLSAPLESFDQIKDNIDRINNPNSIFLQTTPRLSIYYAWYDVLSAYTQRSLTVPSDKLPALSGLASEFARHVGDEYVAGLWRNNLPQDLLWSCGSL